jgi:predicted RND superfamily exporter protein
MLKQHKKYVLLAVASILVTVVIGTIVTLLMDSINDGAAPPEEATTNTADDFVEQEAARQSETIEELNSDTFEFDATNAVSLINEINSAIINKDREKAEELITLIPDDSEEFLIVEKNSLKLNLYIALQDSDSYINQRAEFKSLLEELSSSQAKSKLDEFDRLYPESLPEINETESEDDF